MDNMMVYLLTACFLPPFWGICYWLAQRLLGDRQKDTPGGSFGHYVGWISDTLDQMFYQVPEKKIRLYLLSLLVVAGVAGFLLPSSFSGISRNSLHEAMDLNRKGEYKQARNSLLGYESSNSPLILNELGVAYMGLGDYDEAMKYFRAALSLQPYYGVAHANLATAYLHKENLERWRFERARSMEVGKYPLSESEIYNLDTSILKQLLMRLFVAAVFMLAAYYLPRGVIRFLRSRRIKRYEEQMPDALLMASNGLKAGFSLLQALEVVASEMTPPLSQEFRLVLKEHQLGSELDDALEHLAQRMPTTDTRIFVNSLAILRETGGNLTEIFDTMAETIKERKRVLQKINTMTAEGKTQAYILAILPLVLFLIMFNLNPENMGLMFKTPLGWMIVLLVVLMESVGIFWMLRMVKVKV